MSPTYPKAAALPNDPEDRGEIMAGRADNEAKERTLYDSPNDKRQIPQTGEGVNMRKRIAMGDSGLPDMGVTARPAPVAGDRTKSNAREYGGRG